MFHGACSLTVKRWNVAPVIGGSNPLRHPKPVIRHLEGEADCKSVAHAEQVRILSPARSLYVGFVHVTIVNLHAHVTTAQLGVTYHHEHAYVPASLVQPPARGTKACVPAS